MTRDHKILEKRIQTLRRKRAAQLSLKKAERQGLSEIQDRLNRIQNWIKCL